jgi:hypothetical protein
MDPNPVSRRARRSSSQSSSRKQGVADVLVTNVTGLLTAGHCSNSMHYWHNGTIHFDITFEYQRWDADQDWQWHTTPDTEVGVFWEGGAYRAVTGTEPRSSMVGDFCLPLRICNRAELRNNPVNHILAGHVVRLRWCDVCGRLRKSHGVGLEGRWRR